MRQGLFRPLAGGRLVCAWVLASLVPFSYFACGSSSEVAAPPRVAAAPAEASVAPPEQALAALPAKHSSAATLDLALAELAPELADFLVGSAWAPVLQRAPMFGTSWSGWLLQAQMLRKDPKSGRYSAAMTHDQVQRALHEFGSTSLPIEQLKVPTQWQTTFVPALLAEREWLLCQRKQQLLSVKCEHPAPLNLRLAVTTLISDLSLEAVLPDGIPVRDDGTVAWPLDVRVVSQTNGSAVALAGVPLELVPVPVAAPVQAPRSTDAVSSHVAAISDASGLAQFQLPPLGTALQVNISKQALLGPFADLTELPRLDVHTRSLDRARQAIVALNEPGAGAQTGLAAALLRELSLVYGKPLPFLGVELRREIQSTTPIAQVGATVLSNEQRTRIVEATRGAVDYIVFVTGETEFASQMGADRTWYQARARANVVELWSGKVVAHYDESATGAGFGDQAAEQAAQAAVVQRLRGRLQDPRTSR